jgi:hypothetical protein
VVGCFGWDVTRSLLFASMVAPCRKRWNILELLARISGFLGAVGWLIIGVAVIIVVVAFGQSGQGGNPFDPSGSGLTIVKIAARVSLGADRQGID